MFTWLAGKKTYIIAGLGILTAVVTWAVGDLSGQAAIEAIFAALTAMGLRNGIK